MNSPKKLHPVQFDSAHGRGGSLVDQASGMVEVRCANRHYGCAGLGIIAFLWDGAAFAADDQSIRRRPESATVPQAGGSLRSLYIKAAVLWILGQYPHCLAIFIHCMYGRSWVGVHFDKERGCWPAYVSLALGKLLPNPAGRIPGRFMAVLRIIVYITSAVKIPAFGACSHPR